MRNIVSIQESSYVLHRNGNDLVQGIINTMADLIAGWSAAVRGSPIITGVIPVDGHGQENVKGKVLR